MLIIASQYDDRMNRKKMFDGREPMRDAPGLTDRKEGTRLTKDEFARRIVDMVDVLYRVAWSQLPRSADREDAVQETIRHAWEKRRLARGDRAGDDPAAVYTFHLQ